MSSKPTATKRKATSTTAAAAKKAKLAAPSQAATVQSILSGAENFAFPISEAATRDLIVSLAEYARTLEEELHSLKPKAKSPQDLEAAAEKLASAARSGIKKQCTWKPSCKTSSAKWTYDGVCNDAAVFGAFLGLDGPPTFKTMKMSVDQFNDIVGPLSLTARYSHMRLTGTNVNIHWKPEEGTFKFSGTYGV